MFYFLFWDSVVCIIYFLFVHFLQTNLEICASKHEEIEDNISHESSKMIILSIIINFLAG
jgi:hypothetical protein